MAKKKKTKYVNKYQYRESSDARKLKLANQMSEATDFNLPVGMKVQMLLPFKDFEEGTGRTTTKTHLGRIMKTVTVKQNYKHHITFTDGVCDWDMMKVDIWLQRDKKFLDYGTELEVK